MENGNHIEIVYSTLFHLICSVKFSGWCIHLLCLSGEGCFSYNGRNFKIKRNDAVVITNSESVSIVRQSEDLLVEILAAPQDFLNNQLPANHYGIGGGISLFDNPVIPLTDENARILLTDMRNIRDRLSDTGHLFYRELMGSLALTMIYDLFHFHAKNHASVFATNRSLYVVKSLMALLDSGRSKRYRKVSYYAAQLNVSVKYLSDTIKRQTGKSVTYYIDRYTVPMVIEYLDNPNLSITQIADEMNFASVSYFSRYVTKHLGVSPQKYRQSLRPME